MIEYGPQLHDKPASDGTRLLGIQGLRAVAALLVVWVHSIPGHLGNAPRQARLFYWQDFGSCGVDIFFVISGFIVSLVASRAGQPSQEVGRSPARHFLGRRITRIYPLYWILTCVIYAGGAALHQLTGIHRIWWLPTLLLFPSFSYPANSPLLYLGWTLVFEVYFYLVLAMFLAWTPRFLVRNTILFFCSLVALGVVIGSRRPLLVVWMNPMTLEFVLGCLIGVLFAHLSKRGLTLPRIGLAVSVFGGILLVATTLAGPAVLVPTLFAGNDCWLRVVRWGVPSTLLVGGVIFWAPAMSSKPGRLLVFLGNASYSIYLCTIPALWATRPGWEVFGKPQPGIGIFIDAMWATSIGVLCYLVLERPLIRIFYHWHRQVPLQAALRLRDDGESPSKGMVPRFVANEK
jgi:exopolysaccharide production protein ExoZ